MEQWLCSCLKVLRIINVALNILALVARVVPIFKAGDKKSVKNYRPISVLPFISKLFERMMYKRLFSFINKMKILTLNSIWIPTKLPVHLTQ